MLKTFLFSHSRELIYCVAHWCCIYFPVMSARLKLMLFFVKGSIQCATVLVHQNNSGAYLSWNISIYNCMSCFWMRWHHSIQSLFCNLWVKDKWTLSNLNQRNSHHCALVSFDFKKISIWMQTWQVMRLCRWWKVSHLLIIQIRFVHCHH